LRRFLLVQGLLLVACSRKDDEVVGPAPQVATKVVVGVPVQTLYVGATIPASATVLDQNGAVILGRSVTVRVNDTTRAALTSSLQLTGLAPGPVVLIASLGALVGSASLTIIPVPVAKVVIAAETNGLYPGQTLQLAAVAQDSIGGTLVNRPITWSSSDTMAVRVSDSGLVTAINTGSATVTATCEDRSTAATFAVSVFFEDFSTYTSYAPDAENFGTRGFSPERVGYAYSYSKNTSDIKLDTTVGLAPSTQSMRFDFRDMSAATCGDYSVVHGAIVFNQHLYNNLAPTHVWYEVVYRWSANFRVDIGQPCGAGWKGPLSGDTGQSGRWDIQFLPNAITVGAPEPGSSMPDFNVPYDNSALLFDGKNHTIRQEMKLSSVANVTADGLYRLWVDGKLLAERLNIITGGGHTKIDAFVYNANLNQGPNNSTTHIWVLRSQIFTANPGW
jgi:hypothetical protein